MTAGAVSGRIVADRLELIGSLLREIRNLPLQEARLFFEDHRNIWSAESCLRRSQEALFDIGRHILAKGFGVGVSEYREIAAKLKEQGVLLAAGEDLLRTMAGYRNRMVHFYHEISAQELFEICGHQLSDLETIQKAYRRWVQTHPEKIHSQL